MSRISLMIDMARCIGCKSCEAACKQEHGLGPHEYRNKVLWLETPGTPYVDLLTVSCQHCERPACLRACPVNPKAIHKDPETGVVAVNEDRCTGCGECVTACPYGAMGFDPIDHHAVKCDLCADRRGRGETPACASVCPTTAIRFGERTDHLAAVAEEGREPIDHDHFLMGPATVYLPSERPQSEYEGLPKLIALMEDQSSRDPLKRVTREGPYGADREMRTPDRVVPGSCNVCFNGCPVKFHIKDDKVIGITGNDEDPAFKGHICPKSQMTLQLYNNERRQTRPMKRVGPRGSGHMEPVTWEQALDEIATKLMELRDHYGPETLALFSGTRSGIITNNGYVRLFQQMWGTPNQESTEPYCSSTKNLTFGMVQGNRALSNTYTPTDIGSAELFVYIGDNQAETRPVYFGMVNEWRRQTGARMVAIDPRLSATANKADEWLAIRSGTDMALVLAMINHIFTKGLHDTHFCENWMEGWECWRDYLDLQGYTPAWAEPITDIPQEKIEELAEAIATVDGCMIYGSRGINQHSNGTQTNRALMFLAAMTGNWGRPGGGYFNISSAMFIQANAPQGRQVTPDRPAVGRTQSAWLRAMTEGEPYRISAMIGSNNPFSLWPSQEHVRAAAQALDLYVHIGLFENEANQYADYVLPVASGVEKGGISRASEERRIVWNDKLIEPPGEARADGWIWIELGKRLGFGDVLKDEYKDTSVFWDDMCAGSAFLRGCTSEAFRASPTRTLRFPMDENGVAPETLYREGTTALGQPEGKRFPTETGKLEFWTEEQEAAFAELGLSALPEFYSEREQLIELPYIEREGDLGEIEQPTMFSERRTYGRPARIVQGSNDSPGAQLRAQGFDTELVTGRPPAPHFHSWTHDFWQAQEMWPDLYVQIHPDKAAKLGITDGAVTRVETTDGVIEARAWVREGIRPATVYIPLGWGEKQPYNPWRPVNYLTDHTQRDPMADQTNLKTRLCKVSAV